MHVCMSVNQLFYFYMGQLWSAHALCAPGQLLTGQPDISLIYHALAVTPPRNLVAVSGQSCSSNVKVVHCTLIPEGLLKSNRADCS